MGLYVSGVRVPACYGDVSRDGTAVAGGNLQVAVLARPAWTR